LTAVSAPACSNRSTKAILALDRQHGIYCDFSLTVNRIVLVPAQRAILAGSSWSAME
jgi:hypothetical protein